MPDWFSGLSMLETVYLVCAACGGLPFFIVFLMQLFGVGVESDGGDVDAGDVDAADIDGTADVSFKLLSFQGLTAFFMMFGLVGFALERQSGVQAWQSLLGGLAAGMGSLWVISKIFGIFNKLQSSGTVQTSQAVGCAGQVYLTIRANQTGKVMINIQNRLREFEAASADNSEIETGARIRVVEVSGNTLIVERIVSD